MAIDLTKFYQKRGLQPKTSRASNLQEAVEAIVRRHQTTPTDVGEWTRFNPFTQQSDLTDQYSGEWRQGYMPSSEAIQYAPSKQKPLAYKQPAPSYGGAVLKSAPSVGRATIRQAKEVEPTEEISIPADPDAVRALDRLIEAEALVDTDKQSLYNLGHRAGLPSYEIDDLLRQENEARQWKQSSLIQKVGGFLKKQAGGLFPGLVYGQKEAEERLATPRIVALPKEGEGSVRQQKWYKEVYLPAKKAGASPEELRTLVSRSPDAMAMAQQVTNTAIMASMGIKNITPEEQAAFLAKTAKSKLTRQDLLDVTRGTASKETLARYKALTSNPKYAKTLSAIAKNEKIPLRQQISDYLRNAFRVTRRTTKPRRITGGQGENRLFIGKGKDVVELKGNFELLPDVVTRRSPATISRLSGFGKKYLIGGHPNVFTDGILLLEDRTPSEVKRWTTKLPEGSKVKYSDIQNLYPKEKTKPVRFLVFENTGEFPLAHLDIGGGKSEAINGEYYQWLTKQGYTIKSTGKSENPLVLERGGRDVGLLMPMKDRGREIVRSAGKPKIQQRVAKPLKNIEPLRINNEGRGELAKLSDLLEQKQLGGLYLYHDKGEIFIKNSDGTETRVPFVIDKSAPDITAEDIYNKLELARNQKISAVKGGEEIKGVYAPEARAIIKNRIREGKFKGAKEVKPEVKEIKPKPEAKIPKELEPLAREAMKYKSVEEFIRELGKKEKVFFHGTDKKSADLIKKEGFSLKKVGERAGINKFGSGFVLSAEGYKEIPYKETPAIFGATDIDYAKKFANKFSGKRGGGKVIVFKLKKGKKLLDLNTKEGKKIYNEIIDDVYRLDIPRDRKKFEIIKRIKNKGFSGLIPDKKYLKEIGGARRVKEIEIEIYNPNDIQVLGDISFLKDLYNQAVRGVKKAKMGGIPRELMSKDIKPFHSVKIEDLSKIEQTNGKIIAPSFGLSKFEEPIKKYGDVWFVPSQQMLSETPFYSHDIWSPTLSQLPKTLYLPKKNTKIYRIIKDILRQDSYPVDLDKVLYESLTAKSPIDYLARYYIMNSEGINANWEDIGRRIGLKLNEDNYGNVIAGHLLKKIEKTPENIANFIKKAYKGEDLRGVGAIFGGAQKAAHKFNIKQLPKYEHLLQNIKSEDIFGLQERVNRKFVDKLKKYGAKNNLDISDDRMGELASNKTFSKFKKNLKEWENSFAMDAGAIDKIPQSELKEMYEDIRMAYATPPTTYFEGKSLKSYDVNDFPAIITDNPRARFILRRMGYRGKIVKNWKELYNQAVKGVKPAIKPAERGIVPYTPPTLPTGETMIEGAKPTSKAMAARRLRAELKASKLEQAVKAGQVNKPVAVGKLTNHLAPQTINKKAPLPKDIAFRTTKSGNKVPVIRKSGFYATKDFETAPIRDIYKQSEAPHHMALMQDAYKRGGKFGVVWHRMWKPTMNAIADSKKAKIAFDREFLDILKKHRFKITRKNGVLLSDWLEGKVAVPEKWQPLVKDVRKYLDRQRERANVVRAKLGKNLIGYIKDYVPHLQKAALWNDLLSNRATISDNLDFIIPNEVKNPFAFHRLMQELPKAERNFFTLVDRYNNAIAKDIHITPAIENLKAYNAVLKDRGLSRSVQYWNEYIRQGLVSKQHKIDTALSIGYKGKRGLQKWNSMVNLAFLTGKVAWNLATQPLSYITLTPTEAGYINAIKAIVKMFRKGNRKFAKENSLSLRIKSGDILASAIGEGRSSATHIYRTPIQKTDDVLSMISSIEEQILHETSFIAGLDKAKQLGYKGQDAIDFADLVAQRTQSMYNRENRALILNSDVTKAVMPFQSFAIEMWNHVKEISTKASGAERLNYRQRLGKLLRLLAGIYLGNLYAKMLTGRKKTTVGTFIPFFGQFVDTLISKATGEEAYSGRSPFTMVQQVEEFIQGSRDYIKYGDTRRLRKLGINFGLAAVGIGGGAQLNNLIDGTIADINEEVRSVNQRKLFEVKGVASKIKAPVFGIWSTKEGRAYWNKSKDKEKALKRVRKKIQKGTATPKDIQDLVKKGFLKSTKTSIVNFIQDAKLPDDIRKFKELGARQQVLKFKKMNISEIARYLPYAKRNLVETIKQMKLDKEI